MQKTIATGLVTLSMGLGEIEVQIETNSSLARLFDIFRITRITSDLKIFAYEKKEKCGGGVCHRIFILKRTGLWLSLHC